MIVADSETKESVVAERTDDIGQLARRLIGPEGGCPDFTAAIPLFDALMAEGDITTAFQLRGELANMGGFLFSQSEMDPRDQKRALSSIQGNLINCLSSALLDYNSLVMELDKFVARCSEKQEVKSGKVELQTMRVSVSQYARRGGRVPIDAERWGMMVSDRGEDGMADVMPVEDVQDYADAEMSPTMNMGGFNNHASTARRLGAVRMGGVRRPPD